MRRRRASRDGVRIVGPVVKQQSGCGARESDLRPFARVAQSVEQRSFKPLVAGSIPVARSFSPPTAGLSVRGRPSDGGFQVQSATDRRRIEELLDICDERPCPLSPWEVEFVRSLANWSGNFTVRQADKLDAIARKHLRGEDD